MRHEETVNSVAFSPDGQFSPRAQEKIKRFDFGVLDGSVDLRSPYQHYGWLNVG
jgi:hypothetical protein